MAPGSAPGSLDETNGMFANATEYMVFDNEYCCKCKKYVAWFEATKSNPVCPIEEAIAMAGLDESKFPHQFVKRNAVNELPHCTEFDAYITE